MRLLLVSNVRSLLACLVLSAAVSAPGAERAVLPKGQVVFQAGFEGADALRGWSGAARLDAGYTNRQALLVERLANAQGAQGGGTVSAPLAAEPLRGHTIQGSAMVKAEGVTAKPNPWNGIKFMLIIERPDGRQYPQAPLETGSFDWRLARFHTRIPDDASKITLVLGLESVTGRVWFDQVKISVVKPPVTRIPPPVAGPMYKGHTLPRLRGTMVGPHLNEESLKVLGRDWNANLIRWQFIRHGKPGQPGSLADYDQWLDGQLRKLDEVLTWCERHGVMVVVDLHSPPGGKATVSGYIGSDDRLFSDRSVQDKFVQVWQRIATRYRQARNIWGYDLANEPVEDLVGENCDDWHDLAERAARAIREIDPVRTLIIEPPNWGSPDGLRDFLPINVSNVVYSVHMYIPGAFTHQGVHRPAARPLEYPGVIEGRQWDRAALEKALQPAIDFQKKFNVHLYIGEFSAIRWAPNQSAYRYLRDVIEILEAHNWDWTYHAFREWSGWSVEHTEEQANTKPATAPTERQKLLMSWFAKNRKP